MVGSSSYQQESLESTILAVVHATRKLPHHFQEYTVIVITQPPLRATLRGTAYTERVAKWGIVLGASDVKYTPHTYVKGLVLAGLVAQFDESPLGKVLDRTKVLHGPWAQTYGETSYFKESTR